MILRILAILALLALLIIVAPFAWSAVCAVGAWLWVHPFTFALVGVGGFIALIGVGSALTSP